MPQALTQGAQKAIASDQHGRDPVCQETLPEGGVTVRYWVMLDSVHCGVIFFDEEVS
jgi:hypothetical protein